MREESQIHAHTRVNEDVSSQVAVSAEHLVAVVVWAVVRLEVRVRQQVRLEVTALVERFAASVALVWRFLSGKVGTR